MTEIGDNTMTRGEQMQALRRARMAAAPPFLRGGFRPFFFGAALWALVALALWLSSFLGGHALPSAFEPLAWHRHEMLFGFVGAAIAGFLLTAIPNWTGRLPIAGAPLAGLASLWLGARLAALCSAKVGILFAAVLDVGFWVVFAFVGAREIRAAGNRNMPLVVMALIFGLANGLDYAAASGFVADRELGSRAGIALAIVLISVVAGRFVPSFTRNWMSRRGFATGLPEQPGRFDLLTIAVTALALLGWVVAPATRAVGAVLLLAGVLQAIRVLRWRGWRTFADPLVAILHVGYAWVPIGLLLLAASILSPDIPRTAALHALTAGAMASMILAVMTRASLGHTGRELKAGPATVAIYLLITLGACIRTIAPFHLFDYRAGLEIAGACWGGAFALFLVAYAPVLFGPHRRDANA